MSVLGRDLLPLDGTKVVCGAGPIDGRCCLTSGRGFSRPREEERVGIGWDGVPRPTIARRTTGKSSIWKEEIVYH